MCGIWSALRGAKHLIAIDNAQWRLDFFKEKLSKEHPNVKVDLVNFEKDKNVVKKVQELTAPGQDGRPATRPAGLDVALECAAGEYAKSFIHKLEILTGLETDTSEILNEMMCVLGTLWRSARADTEGKKESRPSGLGRSV